MSTEFKVGDVVKKKVRGRGVFRVIYVPRNSGRMLIQTERTKAKADGPNATAYVPASREREVRANDYELVRR